MPDTRLSVPCDFKWAHADNYVAIPRVRTFGVVVHSTGGPGDTLEEEYNGTNNHFQNPASEVSAQRVIGPVRVNFCVPDNMRAQHARQFCNDNWLGLELVKPARPPFTLQDYTDFQYAAAAEQTARWWLEYGQFPIERVFSQYTPGLVAHKDTEAGKTDKKIDPIGLFSFTRYIRETKAWIERLIMDYETEIYQPIEVIKRKLEKSPHQADKAYAIALHHDRDVHKEWLKAAKAAGIVD